MLKKILPVLKKTSAVFAACLVFVSCFFVPSFAADFTDDPSGKNMLVPLWNIEGLRITYNDGSVSLFEFPSRWWSDSTSYSNGIVIDSSSGVPGLSLNIYGIYLSLYTGSENQYVLSFELNTEDMVSIDFLYGDCIIPFTALHGDDTLIHGISVRSEYLTSLAFSGRYNFAYPMFYKNTGTESVESITGRSLVSYGQRSLSEYPVGGEYYLTPRSVDFSDEAGSYVGVEYDSSFYPGGYDKQLYYYDLSSNLTFNNEVSSLMFDVPLIDPNLRLDFFDWSKLYFPSYNFDFDDDGFSKLGVFLASTLGAFLSFHIIPGVQIGTILFAVFGMAMFLLFVKFFAK